MHYIHMKAWLLKLIKTGHSTYLTAYSRSRLFLVCFSNGSRKVFQKQNETKETQLRTKAVHDFNHVIHTHCIWYIRQFISQSGSVTQMHVIKIICLHTAMPHMLRNRISIRDSYFSLSPFCELHAKTFFWRPPISLPRDTFASFCHFTFAAQFSIICKISNKFECLCAHKCRREQLAKVLDRQIHSRVRKSAASSSACLCVPASERTSAYSKRYIKSGN